MNKQRIILISIFAVTFIIGLSAIIISNLLTGPKKASNITPTVTQTQIPSLTNYSLTCSTTTSNTSLTLLWTAPHTTGTYVVEGQVNDLSTQAQPVQIGPLPLSQGSYVFTQANGVDTYFVSLWVQDASGNKSTVVTTNQINSSLCTSGSQPTPSAAIATTTSTPTTTTIPSVSPTLTTTDTSTITPTTTDTTSPTTTQATTALVCNSFILQQNGQNLSSTSIAAGSSVVTIQSGITSPANATLNYTSAAWSINPVNPALTVNSDQTSATWTPPTSTANGSTYTVNLSGVTDANGNTLSSPCSVSITLTSSSLPNTAGEAPTIILLIGGIVFMLMGTFLFLQQEKKQY